MDKICANLPCSKEFVAKRQTQKYCCHNCRCAAANRRLYARRDPQERRLISGKWDAEHPEQAHKRKLKAAAKKYREGRRLPKWMYD